MFEWVLPQLKWEMVGRFVGAVSADSLRAQQALVRLFLKERGEKIAISAASVWKLSNRIPSEGPKV